MILHSGASCSKGTVDLWWIQQKFCEYGVISSNAISLKFASANGAEDPPAEVRSYHNSCDE